MLIINIQKAGLFSEIRKVIQKVLRVLKPEAFFVLQIVLQIVAEIDELKKKKFVYLFPPSIPFSFPFNFRVEIKTMMPLIEGRVLFIKTKYEASLILTEGIGSFSEIVIHLISKSLK